MTENDSFLRESVVDIDAAVVGISKARWTSIRSDDATEERALQLMSSEQFDILPIESADGTKQYFETNTWNDYSSINRKTITHQDVIPFSTNIRDVIKGFARDLKKFYFLSNERRIVGLISMTNLNCRQVRIYLYSLLSELEMEIGDLARESCTDTEIFEILKPLNNAKDKERKKYEELKERYQSDKGHGVDAPLVEYLYLSDLVKIVCRRKLFHKLGYPSRKRFDDAFGPIVQLRDRVAHPTRSLISGADSCNNLWRRIDTIEGVLFNLPAWLQP